VGISFSVIKKNLHTARLAENDATISNLEPGKPGPFENYPLAHETAHWNAVIPAGIKFFYRFCLGIHI